MIITNIKYLMATFTLIITLIGCSNSKDQFSNKISSEIYTIAQQELNKGNFRDAIIQLEALDTSDPFGPYTQQVQLDLIYAYYKNSDLLKAHTVADRFMRLNPTHQNIDYVLYMKGLIDMALDNYTLHSFFNIDRSDRDPEHAHIALHNFTQLLRTYPDSKYANDAHKHIVYLKNRLANYELSVAKFYARREAYVAVINRIEQMLKDYPDMQATRIALPLMENAYRKLQLHTEADKVAKIIADN